MGFQSSETFMSTSAFTVSEGYAMTVHFNKPGKANTDRTIELAYAKAIQESVKEIVVASYSGYTAFKALDRFKGFKVVVVGGAAGFEKNWNRMMSEETREMLEEKGAVVVFSTHVLSGIERAFATRFGGSYPVLGVAETLRLFGQGTKVCVEITVMAADAGDLSGKDVIAIGGTHSGADTALLITPAHTKSFFDLRIREVICKPRV